MLTENGKKWIAQNLGKKIGDKYCYSYDIEYYRYDSDLKQEVKESNGTGGAVGTLVGAKLIGKENEIYVRIGSKKFYYSDLKAGNDNQDVTLDDAKWVADHDGHPAGEPQYCYSPTTPPPPTTEEKGYLTVIVTNVEKADVYVDGKYIGQSDITKYPLSVGTHTVRITKSGYEDYTTTVTIEKDKTTTISVSLKPITTTTPTETKICFKTVDEETGEEVNAWIYIDGKATYKQTPECFELSAGDHTIEFVADGYEDLEVEITVVAGQEKDYTYKLKRKPKEGTKPIEIEVVERYISEDLIEFLFDYSSIPSKVMRGVPTTFRLYFSNKGGYGVKLNAWLEFVYQANPDENYRISMREDSKDTVIPPMDGASLYFEGAIPSSASLGWYDVYLYYEIAEVVEE